MAQLRPYAALGCRAAPTRAVPSLLHVSKRPFVTAASSRRDVLSLLGVASTSQLLPEAAPTSPAPNAASDSGPSSSSRLDLEQRVAEFTLPNGLHFIVLPRTTAPIVSCHVHASVGAFVEEEGSTGQCVRTAVLSGQCIRIAVSRPTN